ncbi:MAG: DNA mismatch endonuclease Vsr [Acidobacteria bacterium]|nr:DNA mismatch endonuclease Vsr [Acidobacteriota bacterium]
MAGIRQKDTSAERLVRKILSSLGLSFRVRNRDLPGSPDVANRSRAWAVFVHGCFWHRHAACPRSSTPKRNRAFWEEKFRQNVARDRRAQAALRKAGYRVVIVWECEVLRKPERVATRLERRLLKAT